MEIYVKYGLKISEKGKNYGNFQHPILSIYPTYRNGKSGMLQISTRMDSWIAWTAFAEVKKFLGCLSISLLNRWWEVTTNPYKETHNLRWRQLWKKENAWLNRSSNELFRQLVDQAKTAIILSNNGWSGTLRGWSLAHYRNF